MVDRHLATAKAKAGRVYTMHNFACLHNLQLFHTVSLTNFTSDFMTNSLQANFSLDFNARTVSAVNETCPWTPLPRCTSSYHRNYRTNDGSCNNLKNPNLGKTETPFQRILPSAYSGISSIFKYAYNLHMPVYQGLNRRK